MVTANVTREVYCCECQKCQESDTPNGHWVELNGDRVRAIGQVDMSLYPILVIAISSTEEMVKELVEVVKKGLHDRLPLSIRPVVSEKYPSKWVNRTNAA